MCAQCSKKGDPDIVCGMIHKDHPTRELAVFFAIDGRVYQADLTQVANVIVEHLQDEDGVSKPPSLLIEFTTPVDEICQPFD